MILKNPIELQVFVTDERSEALRRAGIDDHLDVDNDPTDAYYFYSIDVVTSYREDPRVSILISGGAEYYIAMPVNELNNLIGLAKMYGAQ